MHWMVEWAGAFPVFVAEASGARFTDVDGNEYVDLCLGDTGAMTGHAPAATAEAVCDQVRKGTTLMLPTEDAIACAEEFTRRFGLPIWQFALTATDANRFTIRLARQATGRPKILVHNWCYHGSVDETFITLDGQGRPQTRPHNIGAGRAAGRDHPGGRDQRPGRPRARARPRRRRLLPVRAGAHQHRHRPARRGLPRTPCASSAAGTARSS